MTERELEIAMRRVATKLRGRASFDLLPAGAPTCGICKGPPSMTWLRSSKYWLCWCRVCDSGAPLTADTYALAIAAWTKRHARLM
jgi:hypothetical protein